MTTVATVATANAATTATTTITTSTAITIPGGYQHFKVTLSDRHRGMEGDVMVERMGHWIDLENPYFTYTNRYVESVWWSLSQLADKDRLYRGYKIQPYCGR